jgi:hypothetical protein
VHVVAHGIPSRCVLADGNPFLQLTPNQGRCGIRSCGSLRAMPRPKAQKINEYFAAG